MSGKVAPNDVLLLLLKKWQAMITICNNRCIMITSMSVTNASRGSHSSLHRPIYPQGYLTQDSVRHVFSNPHRCITLVLKTKMKYWITMILSPQLHRGVTSRSRGSHSSLHRPIYHQDYLTQDSVRHVFSNPHRCITLVLKTKMKYWITMILSPQLHRGVISTSRGLPKMKYCITMILSPQLHREVISTSRGSHSSLQIFA